MLDTEPTKADKLRFAVLFVVSVLGGTAAGTFILVTLIPPGFMK